MFFEIGVIFTIFIYMCIWMKFRKKTCLLNVPTIIVSAIYIYVLLSITLIGRIYLSNAAVDIIPFYSYYAILTKGWDGEGLYIAQSLLGNVILFMPLGLLLAVLFREKKYKLLIVIFSALAVSLGIEIIQFSFNLGTFEVDDLIHNTLGAVFGLLIADSVDLIDLHNKDTFYRVAKKLVPLFAFCLVFGAVCMVSIIKM